MFLTNTELEELTQRTRRHAQAKVLTYIGIEHKLRPDGSIAVLRSHVEKLFGEVSMMKARKKTEPQFNMVR